MANSYVEWGANTNADVFRDNIQKGIENDLPFHGGPFNEYYHTVPIYDINGEEAGYKQYGQGHRVVKMEVHPNAKLSRATRLHLYAYTTLEEAKQYATLGGEDPYNKIRLQQAVKPLPKQTGTPVKINPGQSKQLHINKGQQIGPVHINPKGQIDKVQSLATPDESIDYDKVHELALAEPSPHHTRSGTIFNKQEKTPGKDINRGIVLPGSDYIGPGNDVHVMAARSKADQIAKEHDFGYEQAIHEYNAGHINREEFEREITALDNIAIHEFGDTWNENSDWHALFGTTGLYLKQTAERITGKTLWPRACKYHVTTPTL